MLLCIEMYINVTKYLLPRVAFEIVQYTLYMCNYVCEM